MKQTYFFQIVEGRLTQSFFTLREVQDVIVDLKCDTKMSAEIK